MPSIICPNCGQLYHASVKDVVSWYKEKHPAINFGDVPHELCYGCWIDLKVGHKVYFIKEKTKYPKFVSDDLGVVIEKIPIDEIHSHFKIKFDNGKVEILPREKIYYDIRLNRSL